jgi:thiol-disulfide isomerase/thioredoxin
MGLELQVRPKHLPSWLNQRTGLPDTFAWDWTCLRRQSWENTLQRERVDSGCMKLILMAVPLLRMGLAGGVAEEIEVVLPPVNPAPGCSHTRTGVADFCDVGPWINSAGEDLDALYGKVVIIDFWNYSCINSIRTFPHLSALYGTYAPYGLVGVHSPEFDFEKKTENIKHTVVNDAAMTIWNHNETRYWPTQHVIDASSGRGMDAF